MLVTEIKLLLALFLLDRFDFFVVADLATWLHSGRNTQFGKDNDLEKNPHTDNRSKPQKSHGFGPH